MHRFFTAEAATAALEGRAAAVESAFGGSPLAAGAVVALSEPDAAHAARVLRLSSGDPVVVCDGRGYEYEAELVGVSPRAAAARIRRGYASAAEPTVRLTLAQGVGKGDKMDLVVQKAVEIGVAQVVPLMTARTVVRLDRAKADARVKRWRRIAYEAAKQSGRARIPLVAPIHAWDEFWRRDDLGVTLVPWEGEKRRSLLETVRSLVLQAEGPVWHERSPEPVSTDSAPRRDPPRRLTVVIGPEGGLSAEEVEFARGSGAHAVTLGPRILRTETAGLVASALVLAACGELG